MRRPWKDLEVRRCIKEVLGLKGVPEPGVAQALYLLVRYLEKCPFNRVLVKTLGELDEEVKPPHFRFSRKCCICCLGAVLSRWGFLFLCCWTLKGILSVEYVLLMVVRMSSWLAVTSRSDVSLGACFGLGFYI